MIILGLTGSIAMGKSTTANMFRDLGIPVHDSDAVVHALYEGEAVELVERIFPGTTRSGKVDRAALAERVLDDPEALRRLEGVIHPLVRKKEDEFLERNREANRDLVLLDIPLLFETGAHQRVDGIVVVTANPEEQRRRVMARPGMTQKKFQAILSRQTPDREKRARADFLVDTSHGLEPARRKVREIVETIREGNWHPREKTG